VLAGITASAGDESHGREDAGKTNFLPTYSPLRIHPRRLDGSSNSSLRLRNLSC